MNDQSVIRKTSVFGENQSRRPLNVSDLSRAAEMITIAMEGSPQVFLLRFWCFRHGSYVLSMKITITTNINFQKHLNFDSKLLLQIPIKPGQICLNFAVSSKFLHLRFNIRANLLEKPLQQGNAYLFGYCRGDCSCSSG